MATLPRQTCAEVVATVRQYLAAGSDSNAGSREAIYLNAAVETASGPRHLVFGLSLKDGSPLSGWPIDVMEVLARQGQSFVARDQNQRGALAILGGNLYVPFGGHFGDCGQYRGFVVGISLSDPRTINSWATRARGGGIWAPGGITTDGTSPAPKRLAR
jgi:hypothetical protein